MNLTAMQGIVGIMEKLDKGHGSDNLKYYGIGINYHLRTEISTNNTNKCIANAMIYRNNIHNFQYIQLILNHVIVIVAKHVGTHKSANMCIVYIMHAV